MPGPAARPPGKPQPGRAHPLGAWPAQGGYAHYTNDANYANDAGCGNTLNANQSVVRRMILDNLRYRVQVMHVAGFRFDLAAILSRDENRHPLAEPPVL